MIHKGELKNYLEKSIWEDLEKRDFEVAISVLQIIASNEYFANKITLALVKTACERKRLAMSRQQSALKPVFGHFIDILSIIVNTHIAHKS